MDPDLIEPRISVDYDAEISSPFVQSPQMSNYTILERCRYRFDNFMSRGGSSIFLSLTIVFIVLLIAISLIRGLIMWLFPEAAIEREGGFWIGVYLTFLQMTDPGNMVQDVESDDVFKFSAIISGFSGVIMLSMLIAFITTALDQKINQLKKGRSRIIEKDHTLILGWNDRIIEILRELFLANESERQPVIVILADEDKEYMDDFIKSNYPSTFNTRIVTRSGSPSHMVDLGIVSIDSCKSVICLASCTISASAREKEISDTNIIKTVLALMASRDPETRLNVVAEVFYERHRKIVDEISPDEVITVDTNEILAKILVQTSRSVGLSVVYGEILSFDGCEMYFHDADWGGVSWKDLPYHFPDGMPMGIRRAAGGGLLINPPNDAILEENDSILILAEDDSTIEYRAQPVATPQEFDLAGGKKSVEVENNLIIGWTEKVEIIIREYADYVMPGSNINIMLRAEDETVASRVADLNKELEGLQIQLVHENPLLTEGLLAARPFEHDNIIILSQGGEDHSEERTDSETIMILLLLRQIFKRQDPSTRKPNVKLITEILESENQGLVARTGVNDFIISNRFISMILAQLSEDFEIRRVYEDLFSEEGSEIYLKPAGLYFDSLPREITYADMIQIAQKREEVCLGVKIKEYEDDMGKNFGVKLIPDKNEVYTLGPEDALVVLAEDET